MFKLWVKAYNEDGEMVKNYLYVGEGELDYERFFEYMTRIGEKLDCPTPLVLGAHKESIKNFNFVKFFRRDFVESVDFEELTVEAIIEE